MYIDYKSPVTSKMVRFVLIINGFPLSLSFTKISILHVAGVLDLPINALCFEIYVQ